MHNGLDSAKGQHLGRRACRNTKETSKTYTNSINLIQVDFREAYEKVISQQEIKSKLHSNLLHVLMESYLIL